MFIAGKMLDNAIRLALSLLLAALHKLSETGFPLSAYPILKRHTPAGGACDGGRERNPPTSILLHSRKYTYYYMSTREMFPGLFSSCLFTSAQRIKSSRIFASVSFDYSYKIVITFTVQYVD
jgi:hypothetical protein